MSSIILSQLNIYPIKSCGGTALKSAQLDERGIRLDRRWMLVDDHRKLITQREMPRLALVSVDLQSDRLNVAAPNKNDLVVPFRITNKELIPVIVWDDTVLALDVGDEAAKWFSEYLEVSARLAYMPDTADRLASRHGFSSQVSFADAYPFLLISEASLEDLNARLAEPLPMNRFRPNLVVKGCGPYEEDSWRHIVIGGVTLHVVKSCARCSTTTVNQSTGVKGKEPLRTLATYRARDGNVFFGQNLIHDGKGIMRVGDGVKVVNT